MNISYEKSQGVFQSLGKNQAWHTGNHTFIYYFFPPSFVVLVEVRNFDQIYFDHMSKDVKKTHMLFLLSVHVSCTRYVLVLSLRSLGCQ